MIELELKRDSLIVEGKEHTIEVPIHNVSFGWQHQHVGSLAGILKHEKVTVGGITSFSEGDLNEIAQTIYNRTEQEGARFYIDKNLNTGEMVLVTVLYAGNWLTCQGKQLSNDARKGKEMVLFDFEGGENMNTSTNDKKSKDRYREAVIKKLDSQINKGLATYGQLLQDNDKLNFGERLDYLQEELIDGTQYIEFIRDKWGESAERMQRISDDIKYLANYAKDLMKEDKVDDTVVYDLLSSIYQLAEDLWEETER